MIETNEIWYLCPNEECFNNLKKAKSGRCSKCGSTLMESSKPKKIQLNKGIIENKANFHDRKWRIMQGSYRKQFYEKRNISY